VNADSRTAEAQAGPLAGLRVLDFSTTAAGAQASQTLADFGAEVVQVEHPAFGEHVRLKPYIELSRSETLAEPGVLAGQHTDRILAELGYDAPAIASLRERGIVA
jgi:crotonobetainyl-CoA:carnitine CoA-transferase CaiB-like acyl-CoA transferase